MVTRLLLLVLSCRKRLDEQPLRQNFVASVVEELEQELELEQVLALELEQEFEPVVVAAAVVAVAAAVVVVVPVREQVLDFV